MEAAQRGVAPAFRDRHARRDVFGKARGVAGGEWPVRACGNRRAPGSRSVLRSRCGSRRARPARCAARSRAGSATPGAGPDRSAPARSEIRPATETRSSTPSLAALRASDVRVRTTPLTCGCQASVAMSTRIRRSALRRLGQWLRRGLRPRRGGGVERGAVRLESSRCRIACDNNCNSCLIRVTTNAPRDICRPTIPVGDACGADCNNGVATLWQSALRIAVRARSSCPNARTRSAAIKRTVGERIGWNRIGVAISVLIVAVACAVLFRLLRDIDLDKVAAALRATSFETVADRRLASSSAATSR